MTRFDIRKFEQRIQKYVDAQLLVGVALAIVKDETVVYARGFGTTSVEEGGTPITPTTMFAIGSVSKTLCATMVMRLVEQGILDLDTPVQSYPPNFSFSDPRKGRRVALRHILSHTTGLATGGKAWGPRHPDALRDVVYDQIAHYRFFAEPGTIYHYGTIPFDLSGCAAEMVTGRYFEELMQELVFDPLQMTRSTYDRLVAMTYPLALPHDKVDGRIQTVHRYSDNPSGNPDGFAISCVEDLANLASMFLTQGHFDGNRFLTPESIQTMRTPHGNQYMNGSSPLYTTALSSSGLGFMIGDYHSIHTIGHTGAMQSFTTNFHLFPERGIGVILLLNYVDYDTDEEIHKRTELLFDLNHELLDLGPRKVNWLATPKQALTSAEQKRWPTYEGTYMGASQCLSGVLANVRVKKNRLVLEVDGTPLPLTPIGDRQYYLQLESGEKRSVAFLPDDSGHIQYMMILGDSYFRIAIDRDYVPNPALWAAYAGTFKDPSNPDQRSQHRVRIKDGRLLVYAWGEETELAPLTDMLFIAKFGQLEFLVADDDSVSTLIREGATPYQRVDTSESLLEQSCPTRVSI